MGPPELILSWPLAATVLAAALVPLISVRLIADRWLDVARDQWLRVVAGCAALALTVRAPALGCALFGAVAHWRSSEQLPAVATWVAISASWLLVQALPASWAVVIPWGWRLVALPIVAFAIDQRRHKVEVKSTLGHRTMLAGYLALVLPFASPWEWPLYAVGLWLTSSWVATLAAVVGIAVRYPVTGPWIAALFALVVLLEAIPWTRRTLIDRTPRGSSLDSLRVRWTTVITVARLATRDGVWWHGRGAGDRLRRDRPRDDVQREFVRTRRYVLTAPFHCEPLELAYSYGLLGLAVIVALVWQVAPRLVLGDPWSAAVVAGGVLALGSSPCRVVPVGTIWLVVLAVVAGR